MTRPYIICHMVTSLDGKVTGPFLSAPECAAATEAYYQINRDFKADGFACGRVTMEGSFTGGWYPDLSQYPEVRHDLNLKMDHLVDELSGFYAVAFDPHGRLGWKSSRIIDPDGDPGYDNAQIIEVLTGQVDPRYLGYLEAMEIPYIFAGDTEIDIEEALFKLKTCFGIEKLLLEGGSILNGAFQRAGVIDELSLVVVPTVADAGDKPLFTNGEMAHFTLADVKNQGGCLWIKYLRQGQPGSGAQRLAQVCENLFDLSALALSDAYYYSALPLCIIDAVFSIGVKYTSTQNTVLRYCGALGLPPYDRSRINPARHTVSDLVDALETHGIQRSASTLFGNHQRTSTTNGILKSEAVYRFAKILQRHGIETLQDMNRAENLSAIEGEIRQIPGQKSGLSWQYFQMLTGDDSLAKPDRHILRFIEKHLGFRPSTGEAQALLTDTARILQSRYPHITVRLLDYTIWNYSANLQ